MDKYLHDIMLMQICVCPHMHDYTRTGKYILFGTGGKMRSTSSSRKCAPHINPHIWPPAPNNTEGKGELGFVLILFMRCLFKHDARTHSMSDISPSASLIRVQPANIEGTL